MVSSEFYTYLHCRPNGDPFYVGKGCNKWYRRSHDLLRRNKHHKNIVAKHGKENILVYVFPCESEQQAFSNEIQQIAQLRREGYELCNLTDGGDGACGVVCTKETRAKLSAWQKGKKRKPLSAECRAKMSASITGKKRSTETKAKISAAKVGKKRKLFSQEWKDKLAAANKISHRTPESLKRSSDAGKKPWANPELREKMLKNLKLSPFGRKASAETKEKLKLVRKTARRDKSGRFTT